MLSKLKSDKLRSRDDLGKLPDCGIYVFYKDSKPLYVGRSGKEGGKPDKMRERIRQHGLPSSTGSASFAFLRAEDKAKKQNIFRGSRSRKDFMSDEKFKPFFDQAKEEVSRMQVRTVGITDAIEQTVFEVYAALQLGTTRQQGGYNDFENH